MTDRRLSAVDLAVAFAAGGLGLVLALLHEQREPPLSPPRRYEDDPQYCAHCRDVIRKEWDEVHYWGCPDREDDDA